VVARPRSWLFDLAAGPACRYGPVPQGCLHSIPWVFNAVVPVRSAAAPCPRLLCRYQRASRAYAARTGRYVVPIRKWWASERNLAGGSSGFPIGGSSSRTPVAEAAGQTQLTGIVGALVVALLLVAAPHLLQDLPTAALAAVVIASALGLFEIADLVRIYRIQRWEFWLSIVCFVGVAVFGAIPGIAVAVVIAVIEFLWDGWRPHSAVLGRAEGSRVSRHHTLSQRQQVPGLIILRWDAPLFFANAELFKERVLEVAANSPIPVRRLVVAAEPVTSIDVTAADILAELDQALSDRGIELRFAELKDPVKDKLRRFGLLAQFGEEFFFPTIESAVDNHIRTSSAKTERA
jgi:MFS superfamily sulfate permease-like transporter